MSQKPEKENPEYNRKCQNSGNKKSPKRKVRILSFKSEQNQTFSHIYSNKNNLYNLALILFRR